MRITQWNIVCPALLSILILGACGTATPPDEPAPPATQVFVGTVYTLDAADTVAEAVAVDPRGLIVAVGTEDEVMAAAGQSPQVTRLQDGQVLLPGFLDAHQHVMGLVLLNSGLVDLVGPCLPGPYASGSPKGCSNFIQKSFQNLKQRKPDLDRDTDQFLFGATLDPSRQPYNSSTPSEGFKARPAGFIEKELTAQRPVLILDQSGHFGYVNHRSFDVLMNVRTGGACTPESATCEDWPPQFTQGGKWNLEPGCEPKGPGDNSCYTGLLTEIEGYTPFYQAVGAGALQDLLQDPEKYIRGAAQGVKETLGDFRRHGLTTIVSMAQSESELRGTIAVSELPASGTRMLSVVTPELAQGSMLGSSPLLPACDPHKDSECSLPRNLGANGIKVISDGSTQGCTAALEEPILYLDTSECTEPKGHIDFTPDALHNLIQSLWQSGAWRFEIHANGNAALDMVLDAYDRLQTESLNPHTATVIHATVGEEALWQKAAALRQDSEARPALDLRFTHLIGHVAYWGAVFQRLIGDEPAANIDPTAFDQKYGIPFSLHSDGPVSVPAPLWFVQQAVTRTTWVYPELTETRELGPDHAVSVLDALRAVTIRTAEEKELDPWLGSVEVGKVGDFVVLAQDPTRIATDEIASIAVVNTYLGGVSTGDR